MVDEASVIRFLTILYKIGYEYGQIRRENKVEEDFVIGFLTNLNN